MITVLTPTYNRSHTLPRLFESLCSQTCKHFEWIVIDDGSTDDTQTLLVDFKKSVPFAIRVIQQPNSGKHVAVNIGVLAADGDWIFIVDSDDALTPNAIGTIEEKFTEANLDKLVGLCFRKAYFNGKMIGKKLVIDTMKLTPTEAGSLLKGDLAYVFKKENMLMNPFPTIQGEKFIPELYVWNKIGDQGDILFFMNTYIYLCEYLPDGLSRNFSTNLKINPKGFLLFYRAQISREKKIINKMKCMIRAAQCHRYILLGK